MRVALVQDWLTGFRGGERVLHEIIGIFPDADLYTLIHVPGSTSDRIDALAPIASPLSRLPGAARHYRKLLPLFPMAIERFHLQGYDLVLSHSHSFAKGVRVAPGTPHVCYCMTPIRYVWDHADTYLGRGLKRALAAPLVAYLRHWDRKTSTPERVTAFLSNSNHVAGRIRRIYGREARTVYPCIDTERFRPADLPAEDFYLLVGGFVPYKAEGLAIEAFAKLGAPLIVAGDGPTRAQLQATAPPNIRFLGRVSDEELARLYQRCRALVYPQEEDFGMIAVEVQACGRPVIALGRGGARETVVPFDDPQGRAPTGVFFEQPTAAALVDALQRFDQCADALDPRAIRAHAEHFSTPAFHASLRAAIEEVTGLDLD
jgi:glycosyltransferase involved in cell wall biosynthesis